MIHRLGVRPKAFQAVLPPQLPTAASPGIAGSNHRGEEGPVLQLRKHSDLAQGHRAVHGRTACLSPTARNAKLFLVAELSSLLLLMFKVFSKVIDT